MLGKRASKNLVRGSGAFRRREKKPPKEFAGKGDAISEEVYGCRYMSYRQEEVAPVRSARGRPSPHHDEIRLPLAQEANCLKKDSANTLFESVSTARIQLLRS